VRAADRVLFLEHLHRLRIQIGGTMTAQVWRGWRWNVRRWLEVCDGLTLDATARLLSSLCRGVRDKHLALCPHMPTWTPGAGGHAIVEEADVGT
jgi:hypothetical protein